MKADKSIGRYAVDSRTVRAGNQPLVTEWRVSR